MRLRSRASAKVHRAARRVAGSLALGGLAAALAFGPAAAAPYEAFIDVETVEDLDDLLANEQIDAETHAALTELLARGVDLDRASREELYSLPNLTYDEVDAIIAYRTLNGFVANPTDLVAAGALTEQKLLAISAFLVTVDRRRGEYAPRGLVVVKTRGAQADRDPPPLNLRARVTFGRRITAGFAAGLTRLRLSNVEWDASRDGFLADGTGLQLHVPKVFVRYRADKFDVIAGTYRIGFGERLTFDNTSDYTPNGIYYDDTLTNGASELTKACKESTGELPSSPCSGDTRYVSRDYGWSDALLGVAAGSDHLALGQGFAQAYVWGSFQPRDIYQYDLVNRTLCPDPRDDSDPFCRAPTVYIRPDGDPFLPAAAASFQTLPNVYAEALVGAHVAYHAARRDFVGVTGYGATTHWLVDVPSTVQLDFQESAAIPIGGRYGAVGLNAGIGRGIYDGFVEVARTFDRIPDDAIATPSADTPIDGGGGFGAVARVTRSLRKRELELSLRYFDPNFVNPRGGPLAAGDEVDGQRARGEHGGQIKYTGIHDRISVRARLDFHRTLRPGSVSGEYLPTLLTDLQVWVAGNEQLTYGLRSQFTDKDLRESGTGQCYEVKFEVDEDGEQVPCQGMRIRTVGSLRVRPDRQLSLMFDVQHNWQDDASASEPTRRNHDLAATATGTWKPARDLRLKGRVRYANFAIEDDAYLEEYLWAYGELFTRLRAKDSLAVRADLFWWLDERTSTQERTPQPELRGQLTYNARF